MSNKNRAKTELPEEEEGATPPMENAQAIQDSADCLTAECHGLAKECGWWKDPKTGAPVERNRGEILMLIVSEVAEGMEADRKNKKDDKLPGRYGIEVELADAVIRIFDAAGAWKLDLGGAIKEKLAFNRQRADHKPENRIKEGGKAY